MSSRFAYTSRFTKLVIIVEFVLVAYLLYSLTKNVYHSYEVDTHISVFEEENEMLALENEQKIEDFLYYTSEQYIDKIAKQNLGLVNRGEQVIVVSKDVLENDFGENALGDETFARYDELSKPRQWWGFFFGV